MVLWFQNWNDRISNSSRARSYSLFSKFSYKIYLDHLSLEKFRHAISRIQMSSHRLEIERGRWHRPHSIPIDDRKSRVCGSLEDEFHFILQCSLYKDLMKNILNHIFGKGLLFQNLWNS